MNRLVASILIPNAYCWEEKKIKYLSYGFLCSSYVLRCVWLLFVNTFSFFGLFHLREKDSKFFNHFTTAQCDMLTQLSQKA